MKWFTSKARERALKAERERDGFRWGLKKYQGEVNELTVKLAEALAERDEARMGRDAALRDNESLQEQLQALTGERDTAKHFEAESDAEQEHLREQFEEQLEAIRAERDTAKRERYDAKNQRNSLWNDMKRIKEITVTHMGE